MGRRVATKIEFLIREIKYFTVDGGDCSNWHLDMTAAPGGDMVGTLEPSRQTSAC
jgi:hypothetical protein